MHPEHNLVLTGFMATGKTTVGDQLAQKLGMEFVDTDDLIESRHGPISRIFAEQGESEFRAIEREVARELGERTGLVIATGGRMILDPENFKALSRNGRIFCLVATPEEIHHRVINDDTRRDRPLLQVEDPQQRIIELMSERQDEYGRFPQLVTDHAGPNVIADEVAQLWSSHATYDITSPAGGYAYTVGAGILPFVRQLASIQGPIVVITDETIRDLYVPSLGEVDLTITLPAGRSQKNLDAVATVYRHLFEAGIDKSATAVSLGTSIIGDVAGFAAATYLRGLDLVHCPTNLIAMVDTSVGGKVGLDVPQGRNLIGLYKQPKAVLADVGTLQTLPARDFRSGLAEVVKHGLIASSSLLDRIESTSWAPTASLLPGMLADLQSLVAQAIQIKIAIVQADPFEEKGQRTFLNLGHTFGYGIEYASEGAMNHGEAVAIGLVAASRLSHAKGIAAADLADRVEAIVGHIGLSAKLPASISARKVLDGMRHDKKRRRSRPRFVLLREVGDPFISDDVNDDEILDVLEGMRAPNSQAEIAALGSP
ncbi:MAG TPA: bifunctional shikimate kinase/3-dehydroquinate synthase [Acidimicrobiia bacterium]|nr:bifunctional shikimate kinase/3-dehydroquinate synthase [Acidimicrobiia bacterium]